MYIRGYIGSDMYIHVRGYMSEFFIDMYMYIRGYIRYCGLCVCVTGYG